jgi:hypothetical protein
MKVIVPLAGPDFIRGTQTKAEYNYKGLPLLRYCLESRYWWKNQTVIDSDLIFVLKEGKITGRFVSSYLKKWYPESKVVFISDYSQGAAMSALAGVAVLQDLRQEVVCIDLADICFTCDLDPITKINNEELSGLALYFSSDNPEYSYFSIDQSGIVSASVEKKVISQFASAGVYFFQSAQVYLDALSKTIQHAEQYLHNNLYYVCPVFNGVIMNGGTVASLKVNNVDDVKFIEGVK